ncbi:hypothetical protein CJO32_06850 [Bifidobacterium longum]|nr:hypothetical protein CJO32_06850 [Bifidobacterium longum]RDX14536.1 hypothetical protein CE158_00615 [Bifidobacterium longum]
MGRHECSFRHPNRLTPFRGADLGCSGGLSPFRGAPHPGNHKYKRLRANVITPFLARVYSATSPLKRE